MTYRARTTILLSVAAITFTLSTSAFAVDETAARDLAKQNGCFKCHNITKADQAKKEKDGRPWGEVGEKYSGKAGAEDKLIHHITSGEKAKFPDGHEEEHKVIKTKDMAQIKNLVDWILTLRP